jgi:DNA polymerase-3 subunit delta'
LTETNALLTLSHGLCPWLRQAYTSLEEARSNNKLGHAWLLAGPWGIGKLNLALVMAERLLAPSGRIPDELSAQVAVSARASIYENADHRPDLHCLFPVDQKRTISVDQVRDACRQLSLSSLQGQAKVLLIEPAEAMTNAAANALLKTLEEPTDRTFLWLVSHQPGRLPATIRSRCQTIALRPPDAQLAANWLAGSERDPQRVRALLDRGLTPFQLLAWIENNKDIEINQLERSIEAILRNEADPQAVADAWLKDDWVPRLEWLAALLRAALRQRLAPKASKSVTDSGADTLHNIALGMRPAALFTQLDKAELLLSRRGTGVNEELALRVLLMGFQDPLLQTRKS